MQHPKTFDAVVEAAYRAGYADRAAERDYDPQRFRASLAEGDEEDTVLEGLTEADIERYLNRPRSSSPHTVW